MENKQIKLSYSYDGLDRLSAVVFSNGESVGYTYDEAGNLVAVTPFSLTRSGKEAPLHEAAATAQSTPAWHLSRGGESYGPYSWEEMLDFARDGRLQHDDLVWNNDMDAWTKAAEVRELFQ